MPAMKRFLVVLVVAAAGCVPPGMAARYREAPPSAAGPPAVAAPAPADAVLAEARRILAAARSTRYSHQTRVDEAAGIYEMDCSGLAGYVLKRAAPAHLAAVVAGTGRRRPRAVEFHDFFAARLASGEGRTGWRGIGRLVDARPGDLIAWRRETILQGEDTGHVVILAEMPVAETVTLVRAVVIDATGLRHDDDSRPPGTSGVGRGTMWFKVDAGGVPVARRRNSQVGFRTVPIAIGRPVALPPK